MNVFITHSDSSPYPYHYVNRLYSLHRKTSHIQRSLCILPAELHRKLSYRSNRGDGLWLNFIIRPIGGSVEFFKDGEH